MIFSKFFNKSNKLDKELERNLLFAPNYLIREQKVNDNTQYIFGGHSSTYSLVNKKQFLKGPKSQSVDFTFEGVSKLKNCHLLTFEMR